MLFTKVYKEEDVRLRGCSYNVASVYFHLKNKREYFKSKNNGSCYDLTKYISEYMGIPEITIKRAIATLKKLGLISTVLKGKVNHYSFPILDAIENGTEIPEEQNKTDLNHQIVQDNISIHQEQDIQPESLKIDLNEKIEDNNIEDNEDMGNLTNIVYDSTTGRFQFTNEQKEQVKRKLIKVAASKQSSKNEQVQELINNDEELRKYYIRYIQTIIAHQEKPTEVTANTKELAKERVRLTLEKYNIDLKEIKDFINDEIEYNKMLNRYE